MYDVELAIQTAAATLPKGWSIRLKIERNLSVVQLYGPDGADKTSKANLDDVSFSAQILECIRAARQEAGGS